MKNAVGSFFTTAEDEDPCKTALALVTLAFCSRQDPQPRSGRRVREPFGQGLTGWRWPRPRPCRVWWVMQGEGAARAQSRGFAAAAAAVDLRHDESPRTLGWRAVTSAPTSCASNLQEVRPPPADQPGPLWSASVSF